jgi:hypothetical protein
MIKKKNLIKFKLKGLNKGQNFPEFYELNQASKYGNYEMK